MSTASALGRHVVNGAERTGPALAAYPLASREARSERAVVTARGLVVGGGRLGVIAGPCAVESRDQVLEVAHRVQEAGATGLRGGAFKPRTSPYSFRGLGEKG